MLDAIDGPFIMFWDDDLGSDPRNTRERCKLLKPLKKMWRGQMNLQVASTSAVSTSTPRSVASPCPSVVLSASSQ